jgi:hypothetical protein
MKVVHVTSHLAHEVPLNRLSARRSVSLSALRTHFDLSQGRDELFDEDVCAIAVLSPPAILRFEL